MSGVAMNSASDLYRAYRAWSGVADAGQNIEPKSGRLSKNTNTWAVVVLGLKQTRFRILGKVIGKSAKARGVGLLQKAREIFGEVQAGERKGMNGARPGDDRWKLPRVILLEQKLGDFDFKGQAWAASALDDVHAGEVVIGVARGIPDQVANDGFESGQSAFGFVHRRASRFWRALIKRRVGGGVQ